MIKLFIGDFADQSGSSIQKVKQKIIVPLFSHGIFTKKFYELALAMTYLISAINLLFLCYTLMLIIRIISSWIPSLRDLSFMRFIFLCTEPYLILFRRLIPPIGGTLDISPLIGFFVLQILQKLILILLTQVV